MTPHEAAAVLTVASGYDNRTVGEVDSQLWARALPGLTVAEASDAVVEHYTESTEWIRPGHINAIVRAWNRERNRDLPTPTFPWQLADDPKKEIHWKRMWAEALRDGWTDAEARNLANVAFGITDADPLEVTTGAESIDQMRQKSEDFKADWARNHNLAEMDKAADAETFRLAKSQRAESIREAAQLAAAATFPSHLRDDAPTQQCDGCGRYTVDVDAFGLTCFMPQPSGLTCGGTFA